MTFLSASSEKASLNTIVAKIFGGFFGLSPRSLISTRSSLSSVSRPPVTVIADVKQQDLLTCAENSV